MRSSLISKLTLILGVVLIATALTDRTLRAQTNTTHTTEGKIGGEFAHGTWKRTVEETPKYDFNTELRTVVFEQSGSKEYIKTLWVVRRGDKCEQSCAMKFAERDEVVGSHGALREQLWLPNELGQVVEDDCDMITTAVAKRIEHSYEIYKPIGEERASIEDSLLEGTKITVVSGEGRPARTTYEVFKKGEGWKTVDSAVDQTRCKDAKYPFLFYNEADPKP